MTDSSAAPSQWWMYHGDPQHSGHATGSRISSATVAGLEVLHELDLDGPVLSVPAIVGGFVYVGVANSHAVKASNGGSFYKIALDSGEIAARYDWKTPLEQRDSHGFCGMGCTPAVADGRVIFSAFDGKVYCLSADDLAERWVLSLRQADLTLNQPVTNVGGEAEDYPPAAGWSSPVVIGDKVYVGIGEGENPYLYSFVYCLEAATGRVAWIFCTNQFETGVANRVDHLPAHVLKDGVPPGFTSVAKRPVTLGCSVWSSIAHDPKTGRLFCATGNAVPDGPLPSPGYSNGVLALDAASGRFEGFWQVPAHSNYRPSDFDVDVGGSPMVFGGTVAVACKNGGFFLLDAPTLTLTGWRQMLPHTNAGLQIPNVDPHPATEEPNPRLTNEQSNVTIGENYFGSYSTPAIHPESGTAFVGVGGNNYHTGFAGIDYESTPFLRAISTSTLADAWPLDDHDPQRYAAARPPMYTTAAEAALSSPAVVNDVVFCSTSRIAVYAFDVATGQCLWSDVLGEPTGGLQGGYGYCMGPAVSGDHVVAGALVYGRQGGLLRIYRLPAPTEAAPPATAAGPDESAAQKQAAGDKAGAKNKPIAQWPRGARAGGSGTGGAGGA
jgi:outer membrane protein assembly factor BamB